MLVCYLDDSGTDPQNKAITLGGYASTQDRWGAFEIEVEEKFQKYSVEVLHAVDLENSDGAFKGWSVLKKQSFVAQICAILSKHALLGLSMAALKSQYRVRADESDRKRTVSAYAFCSNVLLNWLLTDVQVGGIANKHGVSLILEKGNANDSEVVSHIESVVRLHPSLKGVVHTPAFVRKQIVEPFRWLTYFLTTRVDTTSRLFVPQ